MKKNLLLVFIFISWKVATAQFFTTAVQTFTKTYASQLIVMPDGNYFIYCPYIQGSSDTAAMVSMDTSGNIRCVKKYLQEIGIADRIGENKIAVFSTNYQISGTPRLDIFDENADLLSSQSFSDTLFPVVIHQTNDKGLIVAGKIYHNWTSGTINHYNHFLLKLDSAGSFGWMKIIDSSLAFLGSYNGIVDVTQMEDSGYIVGYEYSYPDSSPNFDYYLLLTRLNKSGDTIWTRTYSQIVYTRKIISVPGGGFYVFYYDNNIALFDSLGNVVWRKANLGPPYISIFDVTLTPDNYFICTGFYSGNSPYVFFMLKMNLLGIIEWIQTYYQQPHTFGNNYVKSAVNGGYAFAVTGTHEDKTVALIKTDSIGNSTCSYSVPVINLGDWPLNLAPNYREVHTANNFLHPIIGTPTVFIDSIYQLSTYCLYATSNQQLIDQSAFMISPNPCYDNFTLSFTGTVEEKINILISDVRGQIIFTDQVNGTSLKEKEFDVSNLAAGIYFVRIVSAKSNSTMKLIKEK